VPNLRGCVVWLTGLSGSGKTTVAEELAAQLERGGHRATILDGDRLRAGLNSDLGFSPADRAENIRRAGEVAALFAEAGVIAIAAFISPYREGRERARRAAGAERFFEIFLDTPIEECERRDAKGLYRRARAGEIPDFTGVSAPYEPPVAPDLRLSAMTVEESAGRIVALLTERGVIG
jgi:adenylyl-sulfate kinase